MHKHLSTRRYNLIYALENQSVYRTCNKSLRLSLFFTLYICLFRAHYSVNKINFQLWQHGAFPDRLPALNVSRIEMTGFYASYQQINLPSQLLITAAAVLKKCKLDISIWFINASLFLNITQIHKIFIHLMIIIQQFNCIPSSSDCSRKLNENIISLIEHLWAKEFFKNSRWKLLNFSKILELKCRWDSSVMWSI